MTNEECRKELQRLPIFGLVMNICKNLILKIKEEKIYDTKSYGKDGIIYQKAILDMLLRDPRNIETFVLNDYDEIHFSEHQGKTDKNGNIKKLQSVKANMVKRQISYKKA